MKKFKNHRLEKLGKQLVELREQKRRIEEKEEKVTQTLIKLMEKRNKKEVVIPEKNRIIRLMTPVFLRLNVLKVFRMLPLKKFLEVIEVKVEKVERILGREEVEKIAQKVEGRKYLRIELLEKSIRH